MERGIAERGRYPAINVLKSISRTMPGCQTPLERETVSRARASLAAYANMEELIRIGAYRAGSDAQVDRAIALNPGLEAFMSQDKDDYTSLADAFDRLDGILESTGP
jgi:flagellum-specific ATP synthase